MKTLNFSNYNHKPVTGARNGYPEPEQGVMVFADSIEELKAIQQGGDISEAFWKDGWHFCNNRLDLYSEKEIEEWFKGHLEQDYFNVYNNVTDYIEQEIDWMKDELTPEELEAKHQEAIDQFSGFDFIAGGDGYEYEGFNKSLSYSYDTNNYRIGLFFSHNNYHINWEKSKITKKE